jgi:hypothetical protein
MFFQKIAEWRKKMPEKDTGFIDAAGGTGPNRVDLRFELKWSSDTDEWRYLFQLSKK